VDFPPRLPDISASPAKDWAVLPSLHLLLAVWRFVRGCTLSVAWLSLRLNVSISGNHEKADRTLCEPLSEGLDLSFVFLILLRQLLVRLRQQRFKMLDPLIPTEQSALGDADFLLERRVLLHQLIVRGSATSAFADRQSHLLLYDIERIKVVFQEFQLSLLGARICRSSDDLVLLSDLVELHLQLHHLRSSAKSA